MQHQFQSTEWEHNIIINHKVIELEGADWIQLAQDRDRKRGVGQQHATSRYGDWTVRVSNPVGEEIFHSLRPTKPPVQWALGRDGGKAAGAWR